MDLSLKQAYKRIYRIHLIIYYLLYLDHRFKERRIQKIPRESRRSWSTYQSSSWSLRRTKQTKQCSRVCLLLRKKCNNNLHFCFFFSRKLHKEVSRLTNWHRRRETPSRVWEAQGWESPSQEDSGGTQERSNNKHE